VEINNSETRVFPYRRPGRIAALLGNPVMSLLLVISIGMNCVQYWKIDGLKDSIVQLKSEEGLKVNTSVPPIVAHDINGGNATVAYADSTLPTVLYVFTPQCRWCKKNIPNLKVLENSSGKTYRLVGLSLTNTGLKQYVNDEHLQFPIYSDLDSATLAVYHLGGTPTTIVVSPQGKVKGVWSGAYQQGIKEQIEKSLSVSLPGCCQS